MNVKHMAAANIDGPHGAKFSESGMIYPARSKSKSREKWKCQNVFRLTLLCSLGLTFFSGCRSVDCGWRTYRFGLTRADWTSPLGKSKIASSDPSELPYQKKEQSEAEKTKVRDSEDKSRSPSDKDEANPTIKPDSLSQNTNQTPNVSLAGFIQPVEDLAQRQMSEAQKLQTSPPRGNTKMFDLPNNFPGGDAAPLKLPSMDSSATAKQRQSIVAELFNGLPATAGVVLEANPEGRIITLSELQDLALGNNPSLQQAIARVENARGLMIQAGLYPNPTLGYEGDTIQTGNTGGYNGPFATQTIITAGKLTLAQTAAMMEMRAAEYELRTSRIALATAVRQRYFDLLIAQERIRLSIAIQSLSDEVYAAQQTLVAGGESAVYEPLQLRVLAMIAANNVLTAKNDFAAGWRRLSAALGVPNLPVSEVGGSIDMAVPQIGEQQAIDLMLSRHADLSAARARITSNQYNLRLQQVTPIPDILLYGAVQRDSTSNLTPNRTTYNIQASVPIPVFNRNQGNITAARAKVVNADRNLDSTRNDLLAQLAVAYNQYITSQAVVENYRKSILPDQVRVYRSTYERFRIAGAEVDFAQIVVSQQTLTQAVISYISSVQEQWQSTVAVAELLQVDDLFTFDQGLLLESSSTTVSEMPIVGEVVEIQTSE